MGVCQPRAWTSLLHKSEYINGFVVLRTVDTEILDWLSDDFYTKYVIKVMI